MADINMGLFPSAPTLEQRMAIQSPAGNMVKSIQGMGDYMAQQNLARQQLMLEQAKTLSGYQNMYMAYTGQRNPNIDAVLKQNPYGQSFMGQMSTANPGSQPIGSIPMAAPSANGGLSMGMIPQAMPGMGVGVQPLNIGQGVVPLGTQSSSASGAPPAANPNAVATGGSSTFAPFGDMGPKSTTNYQNPIGEAEVQSAKSQASSNVEIPASYAKKVMDAKGSADTAQASLDALSDNLVGNIKAAMIQSGGSGAVPKFIGNVAAGPFGQIIGKSDNTSAITAMNAVKRDTAIAYARDLAGGAQGVQKLMNLVLDTIPDQGMTTEQASSSLAEMKMTGMALKAGMDKLKLNWTQNGLNQTQIQQQLDQMTPEQYQQIAASEKSVMSPQLQNEVLAGIYKSMATVPPRLQGNMFTGKSEAPKTNSLAKSLGFTGSQFNPINQAATQQASTPSQAQVLTATNPKTGQQIKSTDGGQTWQPIQ